MIKTLTLATAALALTFSVADARPRHRASSFHGKCDGIHRCVCGSTQARHFGLPRIVRGHNLWQAREWTRAFPRTTAQAGVVLYQHGGGPTGHVSRIIQVLESCRAIVADERGQYERNICTRGAVFVNPNG